MCKYGGNGERTNAREETKGAKNKCIRLDQTSRLLRVDIWFAASLQAFKANPLKGFPIMYNNNLKVCLNVVFEDRTPRSFEPCWVYLILFSVSSQQRLPL